MSAANIIRIVQLALLTGVAAFGISVVVLGHWWSTPPPPPPKVDIDSVRQQVVSSMQDSFNTGDGTKDYGLRINSYEDMILINVTGDGNEYHGMVHVHTAKSTDVPVAFTLYADPTTWMYEFDSGSLIKLTTTAEQEKNE